MNWSADLMNEKSITKWLFLMVLNSDWEPGHQKQAAESVQIVLGRSANNLVAWITSNKLCVSVMDEIYEASISCLSYS